MAKEREEDNRMMELLAMFKMLSEMGMTGGQEQGVMQQLGPLLGLTGDLEERGMKREMFEEGKKTSGLERENLQARTQATLSESELAKKEFERETIAAQQAAQLGEIQINQLLESLGVGKSQQEAELLSRQLDNATTLQQLAGVLGSRPAGLPGIDLAQLGQMTGLNLGGLIQQPQQSPEQQAFAGWLQKNVQQR